MKVIPIRFVSVLVFLFSLSGSVFTQAIDPALLQKARAAGITQEQIDEAMKSQNSPGAAREKDNTVKVTANEAKERVIPKTIVPSDSVIKKPLGVFGREIFSTRNLTFAPDYNMPTPAGYILAAGDEVIIDVWGASEFNANLKISSEGHIILPGVGLVYLNGLSIDQAEQKIKSALKRIMAGIGNQTQVKVSLGQIRSIKINMVGEVAMPGTYTMPSLATLFNALYSAGGVNNIGSLRSVKVFRNNKEVATLDVYDFLLNGRDDTNIRLEDNDMIIVSPYQNLVSISGKIKRERTFELTREETLGNLVNYAGGTTGDAFEENMQVKRKVGKMYQIFTVNSADYDSFVMHDGDSVLVRPIINEYSNRLTIRGAVWHPGEYEFSDRTNSLSRLINMAEGLKGNEFASRGQITRRKKDYTTEILAFATRDIVNGQTDIALIPDDEIYIPTIFDVREKYYLVVKGEVNQPDTIMFSENMSIEDAILQCGGLKQSASVEKIEVSRRIPGQAQYTSKAAEIFTFNISKDLGVGAETAGFRLMPFDEIIVRNSPGYHVQQSVTIRGEALFEGEYVLASNSVRLSDLVNNAGGLTPDAYILGASLKRRLSEEERNRIESKQRLSRNISGNDSLSTNILQVDDYYPVGIDLRAAIKKPGSPEDIILMPDDKMFIPKYNGIVKVSGAVLYPNAITYIRGKGLKTYLSKSGYYQNGARKKPYVVYMNGDVASTKGFLGIKNYPRIEPGCEIVVPAKVARTGNNRATEIMAITTTSVSLASVVAMLMSLLK